MQTRLQIDVLSGVAEAISKYVLQERGKGSDKYSARL